MTYKARITFEPKIDLPIAAVIQDFVTDLFARNNIAISGMGDSMLFVMKDVTSDQWAAIKIEEIEDIQIDEAMKFMMEWGRKFPFVQTIENEGTVIVSYKGQITLDFRHPRFFDHLEAVLEHVVAHDDLSEFSW